MSNFAKRHYEAVAEAMQWAIKGTTDSAELTGVWKALGELASTFASDNGDFKRDRFLRACQPGANVRART